MGNSQGQASNKKKSSGTRLGNSQCNQSAASGTNLSKHILKQNNITLNSQGKDYISGTADDIVHIGGEGQMTPEPGYPDYPLGGPIRKATLATGNDRS